MITEEEYRAMMVRIDDLMTIDPEPDSDLGHELNALVDQVQEFERANFPFPLDAKVPED